MYLKKSTFFTSSVLSHDVWKSLNLCSLATVTRTGIQNEPSLTAFEVRAMEFLLFALIITTHCEFVGLSKHRLLAQFRGEPFKRPWLCTFSGVAGVPWTWSHTCLIYGDLNSDGRNYVGSCHSARQPGGSHRSGLLPDIRREKHSLPLEA